MTYEQTLEEEVLEISQPFTVRKARLRDVPALLQLIDTYAAEGIMLPRTEFEMAEHIRDFTVVYAGLRLLGCGALHYYTRTSGEIRSLAVAPEAQNKGIGRVIVEALEKEAINDDLHAIFAFTYVVDFFSKLGFEQVDRGLLPLKVWKDCLSCPKFHCCDEIAVIKAFKCGSFRDLPLDAPREIAELPRPSGLGNRIRL